MPQDHFLHHEVQQQTPFSTELYVQDPVLEKSERPGKEAQQDQHNEPSRGRFKPITFPSSRSSPGSNPPSVSRSKRVSAHEPATNTANSAVPKMQATPAHQPDSAAPKSTPMHRRDSTELAAKSSSPGNAIGTNGSTDQAGLKRKRPVIVFDPQRTAAAGSPPPKRDKVELVVGVATEVTCALRINGLKRPLREADLKTILQETGCGPASI
jgi:hypothetical protein